MHELALHVGRLLLGGCHNLFISEVVMRLKCTIGFVKLAMQHLTA
jgi:hypothetical protein